jgi:hypothetical protein
VCRRSWSLTPCNPAASQIADQALLISCNGFPGASPGNTNGPTMDCCCRISRSNARAGGDSGTYSARLCFVWLEGFTHTPRSKSICCHSAARTSFRRDPVSNRSRIAFAALVFAHLSSASANLAISSLESQRSRFCSGYRSIPFAGLSARHPHLIARLNILERSARTRFARYGVALIPAWMSSTSRLVTRATRRLPIFGRITLSIIDRSSLRLLVRLCRSAWRAR